jgi:hypothetical protein
MPSPHTLRIRAAAKHRAHKRAGLIAQLCDADRYRVNGDTERSWYRTATRHGVTVVELNWPPLKAS